MCSVHAFVPKVAAKFIDPVKAANNQPFQVKLVGYAHIKRCIQRIVMGNKRLGRRTTGNALQHRRVHFQCTFFVQKFADGIHQFCTFHKHFFHLRVYHQVGISLPVPKLGVGHCIKGLPFGFLHHRQWFQRFGQQRKLTNVNTRFTRFGRKNIALYTNEVAHIQQFFPNLVIERFILAGAYFITFQIDLNFAMAVLNDRKRSLAHIADAHKAASQAHVCKVVLIFLAFVVFLDSNSIDIDRVQSRRIWVNAHTN